MRLKDKVMLITGAGAGIGRATALHAALEGARVVVAEISEERGQAVVDEIVTAGGTAIYQAVDVAEPAQIETLYDRTLETFGRVDAVCNNAFGPVSMLLEDGDLADVEDTSFQRIIDTTLRSVFLSCRRAVREMRKTGGGAIVNMSSVNGLGAYGMVSYSTAKGGVIALTRSASVAYAREGIRINAICPGTVYTEATREAIFDPNPKMREAFNGMYPRGKIGQPEEIAAAAVFLLSDEASFVNGEIMVVDGGLTVGLPQISDLFEETKKQQD